jgi:integrase
VKEWLLRFDNMSTTYQKQNMVTLRTFLMFIKNEAYLDMRVRLVGHSRQRVDWLTPTETEQVLATAMTAREAVMIRAGLLQGLRRCEIMRVTVGEAQKAMQTGVLSVKGKGGKNRVVPIHKGFGEALKAYLDRLPIVDNAELLVPLCANSVSEIVVTFSLRFGRRFSTHTLRRTFGRNLWLRGIPIETIAELYGHASVDMTRLYLGLNISDMRKAIAEYGTKSELRILEKVPYRRITPPREADTGRFIPKDLEDGEVLRDQPVVTLESSSAIRADDPFREVA